MQDGEQEGAAKLYTAVLGKSPGRMVGTYAATQITLPSGEVKKTDRGATPPAPEGFDAEEWQNAVRFSPAGIFDVDVAKVVGSARAAPYFVMPNQFGLAQLIADGKLNPEERGRYRVVEPIARFPAGLAGAHSVTFILPAGMPQPEGSAGHSRIVRE